MFGEHKGGTFRSPPRYPLYPRHMTARSALGPPFNPTMQESVVLSTDLQKCEFEVLQTKMIAFRRDSTAIWPELLLAQLISVYTFICYGIIVPNPILSPDQSRAKHILYDKSKDCPLSDVYIPVYDCINYGH